MSDEQRAKEKIKKIIEDKTWGEIKKITPKMIVDLIGEQSYKTIKSTLDLELQMDHSQMLLCYANDVYITPKCNCGNDVKFDNHKKTKEICLEKYGNEFYAKTEEFKKLRKGWK